MLPARKPVPTGKPGAVKSILPMGATGLERETPAQALLQEMSAAFLRLHA